MILAVSMAHDRPDLLALQLKNYRHCLNGDVYQVVHINQAFESAFWAETKKMRVDFSAIPHVDLFTEVETAWARTFHAAVRGVSRARTKGIAFDYVYLHTNSDLLVKRDVDKYIRQFDFGLAQSKPMWEQDYWAEKVNGFEPHRRFVDAVSGGITQRIRAEGSFFRREIFEEIEGLLRQHFDLENFEVQPPYPMEEVDLPTAVEVLFPNRGLKRTRHLVQTANSKHQLATWEHIQAVRDSTDQFGIKRFSPVKASEVRTRLNQVLGLP